MQAMDPTNPHWQTVDVAATRPLRVFPMSRYRGQLERLHAMHQWTPQVALGAAALLAVVSWVARSIVGISRLPLIVIFVVAASMIVRLQRMQGDVLQTCALEVWPEGLVYRWLPGERVACGWQDFVGDGRVMNLPLAEDGLLMREPVRRRRAFGIPGPTLLGIPLSTFDPNWRLPGSELGQLVRARLPHLFPPAEAN